MDFANPPKQNPHYDFRYREGQGRRAGRLWLWFEITAIVGFRQWQHRGPECGNGEPIKGSCGLERGRKLSHESRGSLLLSLWVGGRFKVVDASRRWHQRIRITCALPRALLDRGCPSLTSTLCMPLRADEGPRASAVACLTRSRPSEHGMAFAPRSSSLRP